MDEMEYILAAGLSAVGEASWLSASAAENLAAWLNCASIQRLRVEAVRSENSLGTLRLAHVETDESRDLDVLSELSHVGLDHPTFAPTFSPSHQHHEIIDYQMCDFRRLVHRRIRTEFCETSLFFFSLQWYLKQIRAQSKRKWRIWAIFQNKNAS